MGVTLTNHAGMARWINGVPDLKTYIRPSQKNENRYIPPAEGITMVSRRLDNQSTFCFEHFLNGPVCSLDKAESE